MRSWPSSLRSNRRTSAFIHAPFRGLARDSHVTATVLPTLPGGPRNSNLR